MASNGATIRLRKDYMHIKRSPVPYVLAEPDPQNILHWHFLITGPPDTPFKGGIYHGMLRFPTEYPFKPPSILMYTPSGRFRTNMRICLSMSDYHPESWNPSWNASSILTGLISFMVGNEKTLGTVDPPSADSVLKKFAEESFDWNTKINNRSTVGKKFNQLFEEFLKEEDEKRQSEISEKQSEVSRVEPSNFTCLKSRKSIKSNNLKNTEEPTNKKIEDTNKRKPNQILVENNSLEILKEFISSVSDGILSNGGSLAMFIFVILFAFSVYHILSTVS